MDLAYKMGYKDEVSLSQIINNKTREPKDFVQRICDIIPNINADWLATGQGEMLTDILKAAPEISARWLLLGEGDMVRPFGLAYAEAQFLKKTLQTIETAALVPYMDAGELKRFQVAVAQGQCPDFTEAEVAEIRARAARG